MVRHTGTRYWPIIAHCPKYRIEGTTLHNTDRESQEWWECDTWTINEPLIDSGPQNLLSDTLDIVPLHLLYRKECGKVSCHKCYSIIVIWQEVTASHHMTSHDRSHNKCGKVVHRPCSSCISSIQKNNGNSIEFFLLTQTWRVIKSSRLSYYIGFIEETLDKSWTML